MASEPFISLGATFTHAHPFSHVSKNGGKRVSDLTDGSAGVNARAALLEVCPYPAAEEQQHPGATRNADSQAWLLPAPLEPAL